MVGAFWQGVHCGCQLFSIAWINLSLLQPADLMLSYLGEFC